MSFFVFEYRKRVIEIKYKYMLVAFMIFTVIVCATVSIIMNGDSKSSELSIVTSVSVDSSVDSQDVKSDVKNDSENGDETKTTVRNSSKTTVKSAAVTYKTEKTTTTITTVSFPKDINKITKSELIEINGVGEVLAEKIISYRKKIKYYSNLLQLKEISGIGDATYKKLKKYLYVSADKYKDMTETKQTTKKTSSVKTSTLKKSSATESETEKQMTVVNINTADKKELEYCLLIDEEEASDIIFLREQIGGQFTNTLELLMTLSTSEYNRIKSYVTV